jgi:signal transduction histidine kinase
VVQRLFERGAKRSPDDLAPYQGLGLGLYIVRRVMELHGGTATLAANRPGRVSFELLLAFGE